MAIVEHIDGRQDGLEIVATATREQYDSEKIAADALEQLAAAFRHGERTDWIPRARFILISEHEPPPSGVRSFRTASRESGQVDARPPR